MGKWIQCLERLQGELTFSEFTLWIAPLQAFICDKKITLYAPNIVVLERVRKHYAALIKLHLAAVLASALPPITCTVGTCPSGPESVASASASLTPDVPTYDKLQPRYTFASFVAGISNEVAYNAALDVALKPAPEAQKLLVLYGRASLGKTHLLHAIGNQLQYGAKRPVRYIHTERFAEQLVKAFQEKATEKFKQSFDDANVLLIDDLQFLNKKPYSQQALTALMQSFIRAGKQVVVTADRHPQELGKVFKPLKSLLASGLQAQLEPPDFDNRIGILRRKAQDHQLQLLPEAACFIATHVRGNVRLLEGALTNLIAHPEFKGACITLDFTQSVLNDFIQDRKKIITINMVQRAVVYYYNLSLEALTSAGRGRTVSFPRQVAMALARKFTSCSLLEIGKAFGHRDHSTVLYAYRKIYRLRQTDYSLRQVLFTLERALV